MNIHLRVIRNITPSTMTTLTLDIDLIAASYKGLSALLNTLTILKDDKTLVISFPGNHVAHIVAQMKTLAVNTINGPIPDDIIDEFEDLCIDNGIDHSRSTIQAAIRQYLLQDLEVNDGKRDVNSIMINDQWNLSDTAPRDEILGIVEKLHVRLQNGPPPPTPPINIPVPTKKLPIVYERQSSFQPVVSHRDYAAARMIINKSRSQSCSHYPDYNGLTSIAVGRHQSSHL